MSDLVINVRQVSSYPALNASTGSETLLLQQGGLGGAYASIATQQLVATALNASGSIGVGTPIPSPASTGHVFTATNHVLPLDADMVWNAYFGTDVNWHYWSAGPAGFLGMGANGTFNIAVAGGGSAGQMLPQASISELMTLTLAGAMALPYGTLTVARDPASAFEVATMRYVGNHTVASFQGRNGAVTLWPADIYSALGLCSPIATEQWVTDAINASIQNLLFTCPFVNRWNGRTGSVYLTLSDISCVFMQPGQQPITQTPPATSNDYSIANTAWVTAYVTETLAGNAGLATQAWVQANTVASFNGRIGAVTLALSDITNAGGAPIQSPQLLGVPTAPTQAVGNATSAIATTAFVWNAVQESTTGVVSWNGRTGVVELDATDINDAGGALLDSPAFSGTPTAPTAPTGTTTTQLATCAFVLNEVQAIGSGVTTFNSRSGNVVLELTDITAAGGAPIADPAFSGIPTVPTPISPVASTTTIPNTAWVVQYVTLSTVASFNTRTGNVTLNANDITAAGGLANPNVALTGAPTAPTTVPGTNNTQIATTAFVMAALQNIGGVTVSPTPPSPPYTGQAWFNSTATVMQLNIWTGTTWTPSTPIANYLALAGGTMTGPITLAANGTGMQAVPYSQLVSYVAAQVSGYLPTAGGTMTGILTCQNALQVVTTSGQSQSGNVSWNTLWNGTNWTYAAAGLVAAIMAPGGTNFNISVAAAGTAGSVVSFVNMLQLSPTALQVNGNLGASGSMFPANTTFPAFWIGNSAGNPTLNFGTSQFIQLQESSTNMVFSLVGNGFFVFSTAIPATSPCALFDSGISVGGNGIQFEGVGNLVRFIWSGTALFLYVDTSQIGSFNITPSDSSLKENVVPATEDATHTLSQVDLYEYDMPNRVDPAIPAAHYNVGFSAQQLQPLIPEAVLQGPTLPGGPAGLLSLDLMPIVARCVSAIQQLAIRVADLEAKAGITPAAGTA